MINGVRLRSFALAGCQRRWKSVVTGASANRSSAAAGLVGRPTVPEVYPTVMTLPVAKKPLYPFIQKSLVVRDPAVTRAMERLLETGSPYLGLFMTRDEDSISDRVQSVDEVYRVGTFAQILKIERTAARRKDKKPSNAASTATATDHITGDNNDMGSKEENGGSAISGTASEDDSKDEGDQDLPSVDDDENDSSCIVHLLPHRRIRMRELLTPSPSTSSTSAGDTESSQKGPFVGTGNHVDVLAEIARNGISCAVVDNLYDQPTNKRNPVVKAITSEILSVVKDLIKYDSSIKDQIAYFSYSSGISLTDEPSVLADFAASLVAFGEPAELQAVLESLVVEERMQKSLFLLKKELANAKLHHEINLEVEKKMEKAKKEYYLLEHMKGIQKELGMHTDGRDKLFEMFRERAKHLKMPKTVKSVFDEFRNLEPSAMDYGVSRNYLDWLTQLPWGKLSQENFDIENARRILDEDHYGMKDVKDRILEFIAVGKLKQSVQGKILCLSGPPGVGKTSIGKSIAKALNREFYRFSVGGLSDVSEIKGHRRTYVGAMPGKLVQALKKAKTENPIVLIDEIDKIGRSNFRGDPSSALLEVLDPEQNSTFMDHYMDVPIDLSKVLFVCTANMLDSIPGPLLDRMEIIELSGYVAQEKKAIAEKYLMPVSRMAAGISESQVQFQPGVLDSLLKSYCRESGVRNLKKQLEKIYRKATLKLVRDGKDSVEVTVDNLRDFVGNPIFTRDRLYNEPQVGVVTGLAWTGMGGSVLDFESIARGRSDDGSPAASGLIQTGQMGDVMKESTSIAYTFAKHFMAKQVPENEFFLRHSVHLHVPEGAIPKDGPSAGITMCTSLLSLALGRPPAPDIAMTGELTLTGLILKIGGVKEKLMAAKRSGIHTILLPATNRPDYEDLEDYVKSGVKVHFVSTYDEVYRIVFGELK